MSIRQQGYNLLHTGISTWPGVTNAAPDANQTAIAITTAGGNFIPYSSTNFRFVKTEGNTAAQNGTALILALSQAYALTPNNAPLSATNRATVYLLDGVYDLATSFLHIQSHVDIIGIGDPKAIVITSSNSSGTLQIDNANSYALYNVSVNNSNLGDSIFYNPGQTDNGIWKNVILNEATTEGTTFAGDYFNIVGTVNNVLNGSISGNVDNCLFQGLSCGFNSSGDVTISGNISNCTGGDNCFGSSTGGMVTISSMINNCIAGQNSFGFSATSNVTLNASGIIDNCRGDANSFLRALVGNTDMAGILSDCKGDNNCFVRCAANFNFTGIIQDCNSLINSFCVSDASGTLAGKINDCTGTNSCFGNVNTTLTISGRIFNCTATNVSFGYSNQDVIISGVIDNCQGVTDCFGRSIDTSVISGTISNCTGGDNCFGNSGDTSISGTVINCIGGMQCFCSSVATMSISGSVIDCTGTTACFGSTSSTGKLIRCVRTGKLGIHAGIIDSCHFSESDSGDALTLSDDATVRYSIISCTSGGDTIVGTGAPSSVFIYLCSLNIAPAASVLNLIAVPNNVVDINVEP